MKEFLKSRAAVYIIGPVLGLCIGVLLPKVLKQRREQAMEMAALHREGYKNLDDYNKMGKILNYLRIFPPHVYLAPQGLALMQWGLEQGPPNAEMNALALAKTITDTTQREEILAMLHKEHNAADVEVQVAAKNLFGQWASEKNTRPMLENFATANPGSFENDASSILRSNL